MRSLGVAVSTGAVLALLPFAMGCNVIGGDGGPEAPASPSLDFKLATINAGELVDEDDPIIAEFEAVLDSLEEKCPEVRAAISDMAVRAWEFLGKNREGEEFNLLQVMQDVDSSLPPDLGERFCFEFFEEYAVEKSS